MRIAQERIQKGEIEEAYEILNELMLIEGKGNAVTFFQLSYLEIQMDKYNHAKEHLLKAIQLQPDFHEAHFNLSTALL